MRILFVCTGNICRSPTAERLAVAYGARLELPAFTASSSGTRAVIGHAIHPEAAPVLEKLGGNASDFVARQLTPRIASDSDFIVTMTRAHRDRVLELAPHRLHRTFTMNEAALLITEHGARTVADLAGLRPHLSARTLLDIPDPIGQGAEVFAAIGAQIADLVPVILEICRAG
ncbi:low molecular weight phosphatase family protein [Mycolicibacterium hodleri]|uniref:Low molecular weight phosphatase family protein n=1 Tax=Mycolicibacterium hodleri TaxID=49897 RepID=A0A502EBE4_9MYCO|nr:low molecular weight phosphatase family protein [Mycolicibacterium hodleri]TPG34252.1 low molecular weight phosphatase family protein [Mycolicibacterium hodleri]